MEKKVLVGLSGGVDSSVAAYLLKKKGFDVVGAFIKSWFPPGFPCPWKTERQDAMRVAGHLKIPFITIDAEDAYKKDVADVFLEEYQNGRIPNPDVLCNREVKFKFLEKEARRLNIPLIATGHYAVLTKQRGKPLLWRAGDPEKDQSYFLWAVPEDVLSMTLFPLGNLKKRYVRVIAKKAELPTAEKKDSQGVCFLGPIDMKDFLKEALSIVPGNVLDEEGSVIGTHEGAHLYAIGERHGFTVQTQTAGQQPRYVVDKDIAKNTITVSFNPRMFGHSRVLLSDTNWIGDSPPEGPLWVQIRYRGAAIPATLEKSSGVFRIVFKSPQDISLGQSVVLYRGKRLCGGGIAIEVQ